MAKVGLKKHHYIMLRRRGLDPKNFEMVKETYGSVYFRDRRNGTIKIVNKKN